MQEYCTWFFPIITILPRLQIAHNILLVIRKDIVILWALRWSVVIEKGRSVRRQFAHAEYVELPCSQYLTHIIILLDQNMRFSNHVNYKERLTNPVAPGEPCAWHYHIMKGPDSLTEQLTRRIWDFSWRDSSSDCLMLCIPFSRILALLTNLMLSPICIAGPPPLSSCIQQPSP